VEGGYVLGVITRTARMLVSGFFSIGFVTLGLITLLPADSSKPNLMGYYGVCTFAPASTSILIVFALVSLIVAIRTRNKRLCFPHCERISGSFFGLFGRPAKTATIDCGADENRC
jgi:hypothetical protein